MKLADNAPKARRCHISLTLRVMICLLLLFCLGVANTLLIKIVKNIVQYLIYKGQSQCIKTNIPRWGNCSGVSQMSHKFVFEF